MTVASYPALGMASCIPNVEYEAMPSTGYEAIVIRTTPQDSKMVSLAVTGDACCSLWCTISQKFVLIHYTIKKGGALQPYEVVMVITYWLITFEKYLESSFVSVSIQCWVGERQGPCINTRCDLEPMEWVAELTPTSLHSAVKT